MFRISLVKPRSNSLAVRSRICSFLLTLDAHVVLPSVYPRRQPLNEHAFTTWLSAFDNLHTLLSLLLSRIQDQLSPTAILAFNNPPALEQERAFVLHACRYTLPIAWASSVLPVYRELERRISTSVVGTDDASLRKAERLGALFLQTKRATVRAASIVARSLHDIPTLGREFFSLGFISLWECLFTC